MQVNSNTTPVRRTTRNSTIGLNPQQQPHSLPQLPSSTTTTTNQQQQQQQPYYNHHHHQHSDSLDYSSAEHLPNLNSSTHSSEHQHHLTNRHAISSPKLPKSEPLEVRSYSGVLEIRMPNEPQQQQQQQPTNQQQHQQHQHPRNSLNNKSLHHQSSNLSLDKHHRSGNPLISSRGSTLIPRRRPPRVYETHPGNLVFCCRGRLISSKPTHSIPLTRRRRPKNRSRIDQDGRRVEHRAGEEEEEEGEGESEGRRLYLPLQTLASVGLLLAIPILFLYSTAPTLIHHSGFAIFLLALFCYLWLLTLSSMAKTVSSDPGILPRGLDPNPEMVWKPASIDPPASNDPPNHILQPLSQHGGGGGEKPFEYDQVGEWELLPRWIKVENKQLNPSSSNKPIPLDFLPDEDVGWIQSKWCSTCESYRPPRSSHCRMCDCCIDGIDHHCSYLNNCIGSRNYRSFFTFLMTSVMSLMMIIGCSIWKLFFELDKQQQDQNNSQAILDNLQRNPISIAILLLSFLLLLPISALLGYHMFLTSNGLTTVEYIKTQTTKRVLKENKKLISQIYEGSGEGAREHNNLAEDEGGRGKRVWATLLRKLFLINPELQTHPSSSDPQRNHPHPQTTTQSSHAPNHQPPPQIRRSNNFIIGRLCRPDTDPYIDWAGAI